MQLSYDVNVFTNFKVQHTVIMDYLIKFVLRYEIVTVRRSTCSVEYVFVKYVLLELAFHNFYLETRES